jgi:translation initiation factor 3 subunit L
MVDEFIYQFQSFCQFRGKLQAKSEEEIERLKELKDDGDVWQKEKVETYLEALQNKKKEEAEEREKEVESDEKAKRSNIVDTLGYFAIVGLARVQCLSGEYELSLKTFDAMPDVLHGGGGSLHARIPGCHVSVNYHVGFAYFMLNRYKDAAKLFNRGISHVERLQMNLRRREAGGGGGKSTGAHSPGGRIELLRKKSEQMLSLLSIAVSMSCGSGSTSSGGVMRSLDDHTRSILREKYGDKMAKMNNGEVDVFADLFAFACPKFIATNEIIQSMGSGEYAADPSLSYNQEAYKKQLAVFMEEVQQRAPLPKLKSYLRLYTTIPVQKLAQMMEVTEDELKKNLEVMQEKSSNVIEYRREYCKSLLDGVEVSKLNASSGGAAAHWNTFDALDIALDEDGKTIKVFDHYTQSQQPQEKEQTSFSTPSSASMASSPTKDAEIFTRHIHRLSKLMKELK